MSAGQAKATFRAWCAFYPALDGSRMIAVEADRAVYATIGKHRLPFEPFQPEYL